LYENLEGWIILKSMANPEHVSMLREGGVGEWNAWRRANPGIVPDLFKADLTKADLASDNATGINLYRAEMDSAILVGTNFHGANLRDASLQNATLGFTLSRMQI
jgi:hypothetical protein